jgi:hypothetical protein
LPKQNISMDLEKYRVSYPASLAGNGGSAEDFDDP